MKRLMKIKHLSGMRHLLWIAMLPALMAGCVKKSNDNNSAAARQLMQESIDLACTYRDSVKLAKDSATVLRLMQDFDDRMTKLHALHPEYGWDINKGYPTAAHRRAIKQYGPSPYHRMTFRLLPPEQLTLF